MTNKQIIIDGKQITKEDFIDYFSIELTNRNVDERKEIGNKYFEIILLKEQECERAKEFANAKITQCANLIKQLNETHEQLDQLKAENEFLKQALQKINEIAEQIENYDLYVTVPAKARIGDKIKINLIGIQDILDIISEVE